MRNFATVTGGFDGLAVVADIFELGTGALDGVVPRTTLIVVPQWCSASPIGERDDVRHKSELR